MLLPLPGEAHGQTWVGPQRSEERTPAFVLKFVVRGVRVHSCHGKFSKGVLLFKWAKRTVEMVCFLQDFLFGEGDGKGWNATSRCGRP